MRVDPARLAGLLTPLYRLWAASLRLEVYGGEHLLGPAASGQRVVVALWHDELFAAIAFGLRHPLELATVVSQSRDGELIAGMLTRLGYLTARGSSHRGGVRALKAALRLLEDGRVVVVTVDGPRGPRHVAKEGAVYLAAKSGALLVPLRVGCHRAYRFGSWDRFLLPWPFSRVVLRFGPPRTVPPLADSAALEGERQQLETTMLQLRVEL